MSVLASPGASPGVSSHFQLSLHHPLGTHGPRRQRAPVSGWAGPGVRRAPVSVLLGGPRWAGPGVSSLRQAPVSVLFFYRACLSVSSLFQPISAPPPRHLPDQISPTRPPDPIPLTVASRTHILIHRCPVSRTTTTHPVSPITAGRLFTMTGSMAASVLSPVIGSVKSVRIPSSF